MSLPSLTWQSIFRLTAGALNMNTDEQRKIAILTAALGACRGMLYSVRISDYRPEEIEATLMALLDSKIILGCAVYW